MGMSINEPWHQNASTSIDEPPRLDLFRPPLPQFANSSVLYDDEPGLQYVRAGLHGNYSRIDNRAVRNRLSYPNTHDPFFLILQLSLTPRTFTRRVAEPLEAVDGFMKGRQR